MTWTWQPWYKLGIARSKAYPFGRDVDTLIMCRNDEVRETAIQALRLKAKYELYYGVIAGDRFDKIIVIPPYWIHASEREKQIFHDLVNEHLPTKLTPGGKLHVL